MNALDFLTESETNKPNALSFLGETKKPSVPTAPISEVPTNYPTLTTMQMIKPPSLLTAEEINALPKPMQMDALIAYQEAKSSRAEPEWLNRAVIATEEAVRAHPEMIPTGGNIINAPGRLINALAGTPMIAPFEGIPFEQIIQPPVQMAEELGTVAGIVPQGAFTEEQSPIRGITEAAAEIGTGFSHPDVALTLPVFATGIPASVEGLAMLARGTIAFQALKELPTEVVNSINTSLNPNSTPADVFRAATKAGIGADIAWNMTKAVAPKTGTPLPDQPPKELLTGRELPMPQGALPPVPPRPTGEPIGTPEILDRIIAKKATKPVSVQRIFPQLKLTTQEAAALLDAANKRKESYALESEDTQLHGRVRARHEAEPPRTEVPTEEGGPAYGQRGGEAQPQVAKETQVPLTGKPTVTETTPPVPPAEMPKTPSVTGFRPAIRLVGGKVVVGDAGMIHPDIIKKFNLKAEDIDQRGFVNEKGEFTDREQTAAQTGLPTEREAGRQHSTDLPETKPVTKEPTGQPTVDYSAEDLTRYNELKSEQEKLKNENKIIGEDGNLTPEWQANWKEFEALRNKYNGMPPKQLEGKPPPPTEVPPVESTKPAEPTGKVSVPLIITKEMTQALSDLGYPKAVINKLKPQEAHDIIAAQTTYKKPAAKPKTEAEISETLAKFKADQEAKDARVEAKVKAAGDAGAVEFRSKENPNTRLLVTPDPVEKGKWRTTLIDERGPVSHQVFNSREVAIRAAAGEAFTDLVKGPPYYTEEWEVSQVRPIEAAKPTPKPKARKPVRVGLAVDRYARFNHETELFGEDILSWIFDHGGLMSKSEAKKQHSAEWWQENKSQYDDSVKLPAHHNAIYKGTQTPNTVAQAAFDAGKLKGPTERDLWAAIEDASKKRTGNVKSAQGEAAILARDIAELERWEKAMKEGEKEGEIAKKGRELNVGDIIEVQGERSPVTDVDPDTGVVTIEDGRTFGVQKIGEDQTIYVEKYEPVEGEAEFLPEGEQPAETKPTPVAPAPSPAPKPAPKSKLSPEDIDFDNAEKEPAYRPITESEQKQPQVLARILTADARREGSGIAVSFTRRLTVLRNKDTGEIHVVSTYPVGKSGVRMVDPTKPGAKRPNVPYKDVLRKGYDPIESILLRHPVQNFHESFPTLEDYQNAFGLEARRLAGERVGETPETGYESTGEVTEVVQPEVYGPENMGVTDAEAGAVFDFLGGEKFANSQQFANFLVRHGGDFPKQADSAFSKALVHERELDPQASSETIVNRVFEKFYELYSKVADRKAFVEAAQKNYPGIPEAAGEAGVQGAGAKGKAEQSADLTQPDEQVPPTNLTGMGGALSSEFVPGGAAAEDIFGISQRVREEMAKTGRFPYVSPGQGTTAWEQIQRGRDLIRKGVDPEQVLREFEATKRISADDMAVLRAHMEDLYQRSRRIEEQYGTTSQQWLDAQNELNNFWQRTKPMQTEWHKIGEAQQGATDIDTGDLLGMERAWRKMTGRGFTPEQMEAARSHANIVKDARADVADWTQGVFAEIDNVVGQVKPAKTLAEAQMLFSKYSEGKKLTPDQIKTIWSWAKNEYISRGETNIDAIAQGVADDFGIPKVTVMEAIAGEKGLRKMTDELYLRQARLRQAEAAAREWLINEQYPGWRRAMRKLPRFFFTLKVFGHGTVGMVTHVGPLMFDPAVAHTYWKNFFRQYKLMVKAGYHEAMMQDLMHRPNFITARRAGLGNDPFRYQDDYQNLQLRHALGKWVAAGQRGFDVLKLVRQDLFDEAWNALDHDLRTPEQAKLLAKQINHATGIVTGSLAGRFDQPLSTIFFAPRLEASRWAFAIGDPAKALSIASRWKTATPAERMFAMREVKQKARIVGTYLSLLAINQAFLTALGSDQQVNFTNPHRGDFLAFKMFGHEVSVISPLLHMVGFLSDMMRMSVMQRTDFEKLQSRSEEMFARTGQYSRGKFSPFAKPISDIIFQADFMGKPMPFSSDKVPRWMIQRGEEKWTWPKYLTDTAAPIPVEEGIREVWSAQNMGKAEMEDYGKALLVFGLTGGTGIRLKEDVRAGE